MCPGGIIGACIGWYIGRGIIPGYIGGICEYGKLGTGRRTGAGAEAGACATPTADTSGMPLGPSPGATGTRVMRVIIGMLRDGTSSAKAINIRPDFGGLDCIGDVTGYCGNAIEAVAGAPSGAGPSAASASAVPGPGGSCGASAASFFAGAIFSKRVSESPGASSAVPSFFTAAASAVASSAGPTSAVPSAVAARLSARGAERATPLSAAAGVERAAELSAAGNGDGNGNGANEAEEGGDEVGAAEIEFVADVGGGSPGGRRRALNGDILGWAIIPGWAIPGGGIPGGSMPGGTHGTPGNGMRGGTHPGGGRVMPDMPGSGMPGMPGGGKPGAG